MSSMVCRLCLDSENVVDIFHADLTNSERLRTCILLATGINISRDDVVTKHVCASCCNISVMLYKFRINALANDRALKLAYQQTSHKSPSKVEDIVTMNTTVLEKMLAPSKPRDSYAVHPSVLRLFKSNQNLIISNELLTLNIDPRVYIEPLPLNGNNLQEEVAIVAKDPIDVFKATRPGINVNIVKVLESRKRPSVETADVELKRSKIDDSIVTPSVEEPECLNTQNLNVEPKAKPPGKVSYKIVETEPGKENLDGTNKIVLTRVFSKEPDNYVVESEGSSTSEDGSNTMVSPPRKTLRPRKSRPSFFLSDYEVDSDDSDFLLETVEEEDTYNCELCNKSFDHKFKLKAHMRYHKNCLVCNAVFRSYDALSYHQTNVCFKQVIAHQPILCLSRCDDAAEIKAIKASIPAIEMKFGSNKDDDDDDVLLISDDEESIVNGLNTSEEAYIRSLFDKYKKLRTPVSKPSVCHKDEQTATDSLLDAPIKLNKSQIIVEGMYSYLQSLRVPIRLHVQPELTARLEQKQMPDAVPTSETWPGRINQLSKKPLILNGQQRMLPTAVPRIYNSQQATKSVYNSSGQNQPAKLQTGHSVPQMVPHPQFAPQTMQMIGNQGLNYIVPIQYVPQPQRIIAQLPMIRTTQSYIPSAQQTIVQKNSQDVAQKPAQPTVQKTAQSIPQKPAQITVQNSASNDKQNTADSCFLRVKAPWELM